jgi:hypothetical protein
MQTAYKRSWCSWGTFSDRRVTTTGRFTMSSAVVRISVNRIINQTRSPSCPIIGHYSTELTECLPETTPRRWVCFTRNYLASADQRQLRTTDPRCIQIPLRVRQGLHWTDQIKEALTAHPHRTSEQVSRSCTQRRLRTPHSISQYLHPRH